MLSLPAPSQMPSIRQSYNLALSIRQLPENLTFIIEVMELMFDGQQVYQPATGLGNHIL
jgi:hypothetical protein